MKLSPAQLTKRIVLAATTAVLLLSSASFVLAQKANELGSGSPESVVLTAIPPRTDTIKVKPGETFQTTIRVRNVSNQAQGVTTEIKDFVVGADGKTPLAVEETEAKTLRWSLASWMIVSPTQRTLGTNEVGLYDVVIQVPKDALPGGHYAMILHSPTSPSQKAAAKGGKATASAPSIDPRVGTLVYVVVAGDVHEEAFIRNFTAPQWVEFGPVDLSYTIENLSDIHITPQASVVVKNLFGRTVSTIVVDPLNIFPYSTRSFTATFDQTWGLGPYRAYLTVPYGSSGKLVSASLLFWIIPYRILLSILVILATALVVSIAVRRHLDHRNDIKTKQIETLEDRIEELEGKLKSDQ